MKSKSTTTEPDVTTEPAAPRDRHGERGLPPPADFDLEALAGSALLNERETGAILRLSTNTLAAWRKQNRRSLPWILLPNGYVRYRVDAIREFLASGKPRKRKPKPPPAATKPPPGRARRAKADESAVQEQA